MALTFANKITICRILAVPFLIATLLYYIPSRDYLRYVALGIFWFAVISDVIDGYIARTRHQKTQAGAILDPLADKLLLISSFVCLYRVAGQFDVTRWPLWLVVTVISRDVILIVGAMVIYLIHGNLFIEATRWGKTSTFFQVLTVTSMLVKFKGGIALPVLWIITVLFTAVSGLDYIRNGIKLINMTPDMLGSKTPGQKL